MREELLNEIREFCNSKGITVSRFGTLALNSPAFVTRLWKGTQPRRSTALMVRKFMADNKAKDLTVRRGKPGRKK